MKKVIVIICLIFALTLVGCSKDKLQISYFNRWQINLPKELLETYSYKNIGWFGEGVVIGVYNVENFTDEIESLFSENANNVKENETDIITKEEFENRYKSVKNLFIEADQNYMPDLDDEYLWLLKGQCFIFFYPATNMIYLLGYIM